VIPNSQVIINPPASPQRAGNDSTTFITPSQQWHKELYLHPGEWIHLVVLILIALIIILGGVVWGLHQNEKVSL
jgi:integrin alpha FG-GAP repeat containing protein 1